MVAPLALVAQEAITELIGAALDQPTEKFDPSQSVEDPEQRDMLIAGIGGGPLYAEAMKRVFIAAQEGRADKAFIKQIVGNFGLEQEAEAQLGKFAKAEANVMARLITNVEKGTKGSQGAARGAMSKFKKIGQELGRKSDTVTGAPKGLLTERAHDFPSIPNLAAEEAALAAEKKIAVGSAALPPIPTEKLPIDKLKKLAEGAEEQRKLAEAVPLGGKTAPKKLGLFARAKQAKADKAAVKAAEAINKPISLLGKGVTPKEAIKAGGLFRKVSKLGGKAGLIGLVGLAGLAGYNALTGKASIDGGEEFGPEAPDDFEGIRKAMSERRQPVRGGSRKDNRKSKAIQEIEDLQRRLDREF